MVRSFRSLAAITVAGILGAGISIPPSVAGTDVEVDGDTAYLYSPEVDSIVSFDGAENRSPALRSTTTHDPSDQGSPLPTSFYNSGAADYAIASTSTGPGATLIVGDVSLSATDIPFADSSWTATENSQGVTVVTVQWEAAPGVSSYEVQVNDSVYTTANSYTTIRGLPAGQSTEVTVSGVGTTPPGEELEEWATTDTYGYSWVFEVKTPAGFSQTGVSEWQTKLEEELDAANYTNSSARFRAFIPTKYIDGGPGCTYKPPTYHFNGNNRGYSLAEYASYKTNSQGTYYWGSQSFSPYVNTGTTVVYNASNSEVTRKKASTSKMSSRLLSKSGTYMGMRLIQDASDPFCSIGAVGANATVTLTRTGSFSVSGRHKQYPHLELNIQRLYNGKKNMKAVYRKNGYSPTCLFFLACPSVPISVSGSY